MKTSILASVALIALVLAAMMVGVTSASLTDTATSSSNAFSSGSLDLKVNSTDNPAGFISFTSPKMHPGDAVVAAVTVSNPGTLQLRYALASVTTENVLSGALQLTVKSGVTTCTLAGFSSSGTVIYGPGVLGTTTGTAVFGNPAVGAQAGDRTLNGGASETLCFQVQLPSNAANSTQNLTTSATFTFSAEQTTNN
ncbi:MAG: hypothetical protein HY875_00420 [Chloroflexi bacterium]|nr:hypothetical protein [Chloroflexota bacterium]